jgi:hypothetical protein
MKCISPDMPPSARVVGLLTSAEPSSSGLNDGPCNGHDRMPTPWTGEKNDLLIGAFSDTNSVKKFAQADKQRRGKR